MIVSKDLRISPPADDGAKRVFGVLGTQMVLQLREKPATRRRVAEALVEYPVNMCRKGNGAQQVVGEQAFAAGHVRLGKRSPCRSQVQIAAAQFGKAQHLRNLCHAKEIVRPKIQ